MKCGQTGHASRHCSYVHGHTDFDDFGDDAAVNMVLMQETDLPEDPRPLTPQECAEYVESLGAAPFWSELSDERKASCFQAEVVEGIPEGRIPRAPRARKLITQEMMVDGILVKTVFDSGASVCLIPRKMFLHLVSKLGKEFYDGKLAKSNLRIRGVTNHVLPTAQEVLLRFNTGTTQADVPCLIDERVVDDKEDSLPMLLGINGLKALGFLIIGPGGEIWMSSDYHHLGFSIIDRNGKVIYDGRPACNPMGLESLEESARNRKKNPEVPDEPIRVSSPRLESSEAEDEAVEAAKDAARHLFSPKPKRKNLPWVSQPKKLPSPKKKPSPPRPKTKTPLAPAEADRKAAQRSLLDARKGPTKAPPTLKRRVKKDKTPSLPERGDPIREAEEEYQRNHPELRHIKMVRLPRTQKEQYKRSQALAYLSPIGHRKLTGEEVSTHWKGRMRPSVKIAPKRVTWKIPPGPDSDKERFESTLTRLKPQRVRRDASRPLRDVVYKGYKRAGQRVGMKGILKGWAPKTFVKDSSRAEQTSEQIAAMEDSLPVPDTTQRTKVEMLRKPSSSNEAAEKYTWLRALI